MADISKITLPSGTSYDLKDSTARSMIADLTNATHWRGTTTTAITDGATTNPISIGGNSVTATAGDIVAYDNKEFIYNGDNWQEFGSTGALKALAFKDNASATYTPAGSVTQPTFTGSSTTSTGSFTPAGSVTVTTNATTNKTAAVSPASSGTVTYTPAGSVAAPTISVKTAGSTTTVNSITAVGTLPSFTATVANENLTLGFSAGTLPTKGSNTTVKTGDAVYEATAPAFTGTGVRLVTGNIAVPNTYTAKFTGTEGDVSVSGTPTGTVSKPTFSGTQATITVS